MSGCRRWGAEVAAYLDGELQREAFALFEAHLPDCAACMKVLEAQRGLEAQLRALPRIEPSPQFEARFWARLARSEELDSGRLGFKKGRGFWTGTWTGSWRVRLSELLLAGAGVGALVWLVTLGDPSLPEHDWEIVAESDRFELLLDEDHELFWSLEELEAWDGSSEG